MPLVSVELFQALRHAGLSDDAALEIAEQLTRQDLPDTRLARQLQVLKGLIAACAVLTAMLAITAYWR